MASDRRSPRRLMAKYCRILCIATHMNSPPLGLFWWRMIVLCLVLGQALSPALPCPAPAHPHTARTQGRRIDLYSQDSNRQNFANCGFLLDSKGQLISFSLFTYSFVPKWALVSAAQVRSEEVFTLSVLSFDTLIILFGYCRFSNVLHKAE